MKLNQIGTVTETLDTMQLAGRNNHRCFVSNRSGEMEDIFIADLTVAMGTGHIKTGSGSRSERVAKFNQFLRIEEKMNGSSRFAGPDRSSPACPGRRTRGRHRTGKLRVKLVEQDATRTWPHTSTIAGILKSQGLVHVARKLARASLYQQPFAEVGPPNPT